MREEWVENNRAWQTKMNNMSRGIQKQTEDIQYTVFESMQTVMDYIEEMFEKVMVPPTPESAKFAEEPSFKMTFGRMVDITARFNAGIMSLSLQQMKALSDPELWAKAAKPHLDPKHLQLRAQIIGQEVSKPPGYALGSVYLKDFFSDYFRNHKLFTGFCDSQNSTKFSGFCDL